MSLGNRERPLKKTAVPFLKEVKNAEGGTGG